MLVTKLLGPLNTKLTISMQQIRLGIIGYGKMGKIRHESISQSANAILVSIFDPNANIDTPTGVKRSNSVESMLSDDNLDGLLICCPNYLMKSYVVQALKYKKHVFCEKPPGINLQETKEMKRALLGTELKLMFGFNHRHHESIRYAKKIIDSQKFGSVLWMRGRYGKSVPNNFYSDWRSKREYSGGGIFIDQGIHMLDLFMHIVGPFDDIHSFVSNLYWKGGIEDNVFAIFRNKKGQVASLHSTMTQWRHLFSFEIFLEKGYIVVNGLKTSSNTYGSETVAVANNRADAPSASFTDQEIKEFPVDSSWKIEINNFINSIINNSNILDCGIDDAVNLMTMVDKVYENK
jgi:1,5-anhydro-D-fructose reductase (1,5-anhydro-D-mannitol-forming)